MKYFV